MTFDTIPKGVLNTETDKHTINYGADGMRLEQDFNSLISHIVKLLTDVGKQSPFCMPNFTNVSHHIMGRLVWYIRCEEVEPGSGIGPEHKIEDVIEIMSYRTACDIVYETKDPEGLYRRMMLGTIREMVSAMIYNLPERLAVNFST